MDRATPAIGSREALTVSRSWSSAPPISSPDPTEILAVLVEMPRIDESAAVNARSFQLSGLSINNRTMDMSRIDEVVTLGDTEV